MAQGPSAEALQRWGLVGNGLNTLNWALCSFVEAELKTLFASIPRFAYFLDIFISNVFATG